MIRSRLCFWPLWGSAAFLFAAANPAWARPEINYNFSLNGDLWGNSFSSNFRLDDSFHISGMNMNVLGPSFSAEAGDIYATWNDLGLASRNFQGIKTDFPVGKTDLSLIGGTVVLDPDVLRRPDPLQPLKDDDLDPITSTVYGLRVARALNKRLGVNAMQLMTPGASDADGKQITTLGLDYHPSLREKLTLELARSDGGMGWQLNGIKDMGRLKIQAGFRQAGSNFSTAGNPILQTRLNGGELNLQYKLAAPLTFNILTQRYNDGHGGHTYYDNASLRFARKNSPIFTLFWRAAEMNRPEFAGHSERLTETTNVGMRVEHKLGDNRLSFQYDRFDYSAHSDDDFGVNSDRYTFRWQRPLGKQTQMSFAQVIDYSHTDDGEKGRSLYTSLDMRHRLGNSGMRVDLGIQYANRISGDRNGTAFFGHFGFNYRMKSGNLIGVQYRARLTGSGSLSNNYPDRLYLTYQHQFGGGYRGRLAGLSARDRKQLGKIIGRVFEDKNNNGKWDEGEPGISEVTVRARGTSPLQTDSGGRFSFADLHAGETRLMMSAKTLPIEFTVMIPTEFPVTVPAGKTATIDFPVVRTGSVSGKIFLDANRNGVQDSNEAGVSGAVVQAEDTQAIAFTESDGSFTIYGLAPRQWKISVDFSTLREEYEATGQGFAEVKVTPNKETGGVALGIMPKPREVISTFQKTDY